MSNIAAFIVRPAAATPLKSISTQSLLSLPPVVLDNHQSSTSLSVAGKAGAMMDYSAEALGFFTGVRIPAALIAGSSLQALFSLIWLANKQRRELSRPEAILIRSYHMFSLISMVLSLNVVVMSTVAATTLLLKHHDTVATSAYGFLNSKMRYEFVLTRWSFLVSILSFLVAVTQRALLEFHLIKRPRRKFGLFLVLCMTSLILHLMSYINETLYCWGSLGSMTATVCELVFHRAMKQRKPLEILSMLSAFAAFLWAPYIVVREATVQYGYLGESSEDADDEQ